MQNELQNGETLQHGKYVILSVLGKGGFGITYLAEHSVLKKKVAIKELFLSTQSIFCSRKEDDSRTVRPHFQAQDFEVFKEKFLTEASTLARFTGQKGIVQINDTFPENNTVYFVMDFIDGYSVKEIVHQKGVLSEKEAITYILQILYALKEVHAADILHRDIKPDNLIIRKQDDQIILIDFGIAREFSEDETQTQTAMISVGYAPPEQKLTKAKRSQSMDLYSVGAVLYFCLTSQRPQTSDEILSEEYLSAKKLNPKISDTLNQIIDKSIAKRPKERFQTASEMIEVLENYSISDGVSEDTNNGNFNQKPVFEEDDNTIIETQNDFVKEEGIINTTSEKQTNEKQKERFFLFDFSIKDRLSREQYIRRVVILLLITFFCVSLAVFINVNFYSELGTKKVGQFVIFITFIYVVPIQLIQTIRRLKDINGNLGLIILLFIPFINIIFILFLFFIKGAEENTRYTESISNGVKENNISTVDNSIEIIKVIFVHLLFGFGFYYLDKTVKRKFIYPIFGIYAWLSFANVVFEVSEPLRWFHNHTGFGVFTIFLGWGITYIVGYIDLIKHYYKMTSK